MSEENEFALPENFPNRERLDEFSLRVAEGIRRRLDICQRELEINQTERHLQIMRQSYLNRALFVFEEGIYEEMDECMLTLISMES